MEKSNNVEFRTIEKQNQVEGFLVNARNMRLFIGHN